MDISSLQIVDIQPSQFYISEKKIENIQKWFRVDDLSNFDPVPIKLLNGNIIFTDGHTRAFVAYNAGVMKIPLIWDKDRLDWEAYQICVDACKNRRIRSIENLKDKILPESEYTKHWNGWCDVMQEVLELQRLHT